VVDEALAVSSAPGADPQLLVPNPSMPANKVALTFPNTTLGKGAANAYDVDNGGGRGRWVPSVSPLQYANTLAAWYGLAQDNATLDYVFPLLRANFATAPGGVRLGFV
jgi:hypothetical protein